MEVFGGEEPGGTMRTSILSFGFKHGVPLDVDLMFDCRFLPNPYWDESLRSHSGLEPEVRKYVLDRPETAAIPRQVGRPVGHAAPGLHPGGQVVPDGGHGLYRGPPPIGGAGRGAGPPPRWPRHARHRRSTGTWTGERARVAREGIWRRSRRPAGRRCHHDRWWPSAAATAWPPRCGRCGTYTDRITAIVSVADDGGSSGRLRELLHIIPPGDLRKCLVAMAEPGSLLASAFEFRFTDEELAGHALGNLVLAGLIDGTNDPVAALDEACRLLGVKGGCCRPPPIQWS